MRVEKLFGHQLGEFLADVSKARKLKGGDWMQELPLKAAAPYDVYNRMALYYTKADSLLYKIRLTSSLKKNTMPNKADVLSAVADGIGKKFADILVLKKENDIYVAEFAKDCGQKLIVKTFEDAINSKKTNKTITGFRFLLEFEDADLHTNGISAERFKATSKGVSSAKGI